MKTKSKKNILPFGGGINPEPPVPELIEKSVQLQLRNIMEHKTAELKYLAAVNLIVLCQEVLALHIEPGGISEKQTISHLLTILDDQRVVRMLPPSKPGLSLIVSRESELQAGLKKR
mgnify:CR=1 FL=1